MARQTINIGDNGLAVRDVINSNFIETYAALDNKTYYPRSGESFNVAVTNAASYENIYVNAAMVLTGNVTTDKNLIIPKGGTIGGTFTLTHTGYIIAGYYKIFESELTVAGYNANKFIVVDWWGIDKTGVIDSFPAFYKAFQRMGVGFTLKVSSGYYLLMAESFNPGLRNDCVYDFNNAVINLDGSNYLRFGNYTTRYAFDSNPFSTDFVKDSNYIVVNNKNEWLALPNWGDHIKICLTTTEVIWDQATSDYYDALSIDFDRFETVDGVDRMYFKYPCPRDFKTSDTTYPLRQYGDDLKVVRYWGLTKNVEWKNLSIVNGSLFFSNLYDLKLNNLSFKLNDDKYDVYTAALELIQSDLVTINNYSANNYHKSGYGYGITCSNVSRLFLNHAKITDCRHSVSFGGGYATMSYLFRINDIELIGTGKQYVGNDIDAHGNLIDFVVDNVRCKNITHVYSSRSGVGIIRNVYADKITNDVFYFSNSAALVHEMCGVQNALIHNSTAEVVVIGYNVDYVVFDNVHCDSDVLFLVNNGIIDVLVINNCYVNKRPVVISDITNNGTINKIYINGVLSE